MAERENIQIFEVNLEAVQQPDAYDAELNVELPQNIEANMQLEIPEINVIVPIITSISENGVELPVDENGNVDIAVPTKVSELDNDEDFVSESELSSVAFSGDYDDLIDKPDIEDIAAAAAGSAVSAHNESDEAHPDIRNEIGTVRDIAEGANIAIVFDDYSALVTFFNSESDSLKVGTNLYVKTVEVPDLWISSVESTSVSYTYTTDDDFLSHINNNGQIGYYKLSQLETQKVDLSNYATSNDLNTGLAGKVSKSGDTMTGGLLLDATSNNWIGAKRPEGSSLYRDCIYWSPNGAGTNFGQTSPNYDGIQTTFAKINSANGLIMYGARGVYENGSTDEANRLQRYDKIFTTGIVSDTKTWATDSDGKCYYTISDPVTGAIPNSFITEWNTKCGLYGRQSLPSAFNPTTGYFELNGLSDITYEEAIIILAESTLLTMQGTNYPYSRTNLGIRLNSIGMGRQWQESNSEVAYWANTTWSLGSSTTSTTFLYNANRLREILFGHMSGVSGTLQITGCPSLTTITIASSNYGMAGNLILTGCPNLSLQSMVTLVDTATNSSAKTYRVTGNTWTACQNDTTEYTYGGQTYVGIIAYAAAKDITITN